MSRNAVARECGVSPSTVSRICAEAKPPITFDREATKTAVAAHQLDLKAERAKISEDIITEAKRLIGKMTAPHVKIGWYMGMASKAYLEGPESGDVKNYATALGILLDKHAMLVKMDSDDRDLPAVDAWLAAMMPGVSE